MSTKLYDISDWCKRGTEVKDYPYIGEVDTDVAIGTVIKVRGKYYCPGITGIGYAGVELIKLSNNPDNTKYTSNITCPYCGYENKDSWEADDSDDNYECGKCMAMFEYERIVTVDYISIPKIAPNIVETEWVSGKRRERDD